MSNHGTPVVAIRLPLWVESRRQTSLPVRLISVKYSLSRI
jgi:hypothetical protein